MSVASDVRVALPIVVKIGGSLITNKAGFCEHNTERIVALGNEIAALEPALRRRLIVILGGGSFSHGIALRYGLVDVPPSAVRADFSRLTIGMFRMMATIADLWREAGINVYPIQPATQVRIAGGELRVTADHFVTSLAHELVPLTTGDIALLPHLTSRPVSGDWLAVLLAREIRIACAVFMTDVPGIVDRASGTTIPTVSLRSPDTARASVGGSSNPDVTGGMAAKLEAALSLAALGVTTRIIDGRESSALANALSGVGWSGTEVVA